jgi:hypothetical protein
MRYTIFCLLKYTELKLCSCFEWVWNLVVSFREEHRLRVFENRVLRKVFGCEGRGNGGVDNEQRHDLYCSSLAIVIRVVTSRRT